ncbi:MAG: MgtC/SapB family protein [Dongiaceae bacterium]
MQLTLDWPEIALRLALALAAGGVIGFDRGERGRSAGLRTTLLVCLAAAIAMLQANLLLPTDGRQPGSFAQIDVMRLPLGILTGVGFIGGGAILRRDNRVTGVTTAATLWFATVIGLCFGGGQLGLGLVALVLATVVLTVLRWVELRLPRERRGTLTLTVEPGALDEAGVRDALHQAGLRLVGCAATYRAAAMREIRCEVRWPGRATDPKPPGFVPALARHPGVAGLHWQG